MSATRKKLTIFSAILLGIAAVVVMLGLGSTQAFAAELESNAAPTEEISEEILLYSEQSVPVEQEITEADYEKMENQYNIHPDYTPVIESKTQETETTVSQTATGLKTTNKTTTAWVVRDTDTSEAPTTTQTTLTTTPAESTQLIILAVAIPAVVAAAPVILAASPVILAVAVPAVLAGSLLKSKNNKGTATTKTNTTNATTSGTSAGSSSPSAQDSIGSLAGAVG